MQNLKYLLSGRFWQDIAIDLTIIITKLEKIIMTQQDLQNAIADNAAAIAAESTQIGSLATLVGKIDADVQKLLARSTASPGLDFTKEIQALQASTAQANQNAAALAAAQATLTTDDTNANAGSADVSTDTGSSGAAPAAAPVDAGATAAS